LKSTFVFSVSLKVKIDIECPQVPYLEWQHAAEVNIPRFFGILKSVRSGYPYDSLKVGKVGYPTKNSASKMQFRGYIAPVLNWPASPCLASGQLL
jgi:hypothetical protein